MTPRGTLRHDDLLAELPPGPQLSRERQTARMAVRPAAFLQELWTAYGDIFTIHLIDERPWVIAGDPESITQVLRAPPEALHAGEARRVMEPVLGANSVLLLDEDRHMEQRKLLLPPFGAGHVGRYQDAMRRAAERAMDRWPVGREEAAAPWTRAITLEVMLHAVFGVGKGVRLDALRCTLRDLQLPGNSREAKAPAFVEALAQVDELVYAEIANRAPVAQEGEDVLSLLLMARHEDGSPMSREEIRDELISLLVAGYETTATTLAWALALLARDASRLSLAAAAARQGDSDYIDAVVKETLRLRPAVPLIPRLAKAPFALGEYLIPPDTTLIAAVLLLHHRADLYPDPCSFQPERFTANQPGAHTWLPFGGGVRRCIGARFALLEMRVVLAALLDRFHVRAVDERPEAMRSRDVTLTPSRGAPVILEPRRRRRGSVPYGR